MIIIKRIFISSILFLSILMFVIYANNNLSSLCNNIENTCNELEILINDKNWETALIKTDKLITEITDNKRIIALYINHSDFDLLFNETLKLNLYVECKDNSESHASLHILKYTAQNIRALNTLSLENIF